MAVLDVHTKVLLAERQVPSHWTTSRLTDSGDRLGIAISEAVEAAATHDDALGSALMPVLLHQRRQMAAAGEAPDVIAACVGARSKVVGLAFTLVGEKLRQGATRRIVAVEPEACPTLTGGSVASDSGATVGLTPLLSQLIDDGLVEATGRGDYAVFERAMQCARGEGILPAPESAHAIRVPIDEARRGDEAGEKRVVLFNLSNNGQVDPATCDAATAA